MNQRRLQRYLCENGFRAEKAVRHGVFWIDDQGKRILLSRSTAKLDPRAIKNTMAQINRIVRERPAAEKPPKPEIVDVMPEQTYQMVSTDAAPEREPRRVIIVKSPFNPALAVNPYATPSPEPVASAEVTAEVTAEKEPEMKTKAMRSYAKFTHDHRMKLRAEAYQWLQEGLSPMTIQERWNNAGVCSASGKPWGKPEIHSFIRNMRIKEASIKKWIKKHSPQTLSETPMQTLKTVSHPIKTQMPKVTKLPDSVALILMDEDLDDSMKVRMITAWARI